MTFEPNEFAMIEMITQAIIEWDNYIELMTEPLIKNPSVKSLCNL